MNISGAGQEESCMARAALAIDLGATRTRVAIVNGEGEILRKTEHPTWTQESTAESITSSIARSARALILEESGTELVGAGVSVAGPVDVARGVVVNPPNIPFREIPIVAPLQEALHLPVRLANDCHAGVLGEMAYGRGSGRGNVVYVTISTGIGAGVVENGRVLLGRGGNAAEIGHFTLDTTYNLVCGCGHRGHWEGYASGRFIPRFFAAWSERRGMVSRGFGRPEDIFRAASEGNEDALAFVQELGRINARGISNIVVAYDPELIVLDGAVARLNRGLILPPIMEHADRFLPLPEIEFTALEGDAPLLGAAILASGYDTMFGPLEVPQGRSRSQTR